MDHRIVFEDLIRDLKVCDWKDAMDCIEVLINWLEDGGSVDSLTLLPLASVYPRPKKVTDLLTKFNNLLMSRYENGKAESA